MENRSVSIVIPTFNRAEMVGKAIESALMQTVPAEVVVCDHGSTDDTPALVRSYGEAVRYLRRESDSGPALAWLDGLSYANGKFVHLTFDDDWLHPSFIERCLELMAEDCAFVFSAASIHSDSSKELHLCDLFTTGSHDARLVERLLLGMGTTISPGCALFRKKDAVASLLTGPPLGCSSYHGAGPDLQMFVLPLLRYPRFAYINEPLAHFRAHKGSITVDAVQTPRKMGELSAAYTDVRRHYLVLRHARKRELGHRLLRRWQWGNFWVRKMRSAKRRIGRLMERVPNA